MPKFSTRINKEMEKNMRKKVSVGVGILRIPKAKMWS
jgi:hypothetical protein